MVSICKKALALIWKCLLLRRRNLLVSSVELILLLFGACITYFVLLDYGRAEISTQSLVKHFTYSNPYSLYGLPITAQIAFTPKNNFTEKIFHNLYNKSIFHRHSDEKVPVPLEDEDTLEEWLRSRSYEEGSFHNEIVGIVFLDVNDSAKMFKYEIRSNNLRLYLSKPSLFTLVDKYDGSEFMRIQFHLDRELLNHVGVEVTSLGQFIGHLPVPSSVPTISFAVLYLYLVMAYIVLVVSLMKEVLWEKSTGITEYMKVAGIPPSMIWIHWIVYVLIVHFPITLAFTASLLAIIPSSNTSELVTFWLIFLLFILNSAVLQLFVSTFFFSPTMALIIFTCFWVTLHIISVVLFFFARSFITINTLTETVFCLLPLNNLIWALHTLGSYHGTWTTSKMFFTKSDRSSISIGQSVTTFVLETLFLVLIQPTLRSIIRWKRSLGNKILSTDDSTNFKNMLLNMFEMSSKQNNIVLEVRGASYERGWLKREILLERLDLKVYKGETLALLGNDDINKLTAVSLIVGVFPPTSGAVLYKGLSIQSDSTKSNYTECLGFYPRHSPYFTKFTVLDHIIFFGMVKGLSYCDAKKKSTELLDLFGIPDKRYSLLGNLSDETKKRVLFAISLVGNPAILIVDGPTVGLDNQSRRELWNIFSNLRGSCTILISTDSMEEADMLGDRIAIMDKGRVIGCGSPTFLKTYNATGYKIRITTQQGSQLNKISSLINQYLSDPKVEILPPSNTTIVEISVTKSSVDQFPVLFEALENYSDECKITYIEISCTTFEDVILQAGERASEIKPIEDTISSQQLDPSRIITRGIDLTFQRLRVLFWQRIYYRCRNIWPIVLLALISTALMFNTSTSTNYYGEDLITKSDYPLQISLGLYPLSTVLIVFNGDGYRIAHIAADIVRRHGGRVTVINDTSVLKYMINLYQEDIHKYFSVLLALQCVDGSLTLQYLGAAHVAPVAANLLSNILLRNFTDDKSGSIQVTNNLFQYNKNVKCDIADSYVDTVSIMWYINFTLILSCLTTLCVSFIIVERVSGIKHQQFLAGVSPLPFWTMNFIFDYFSYLCLAFVFVLIIAMFAGEIVLFSGFIEILTCILAIYGITGTLFMYLYSYLTNSRFLGIFIFILCEIVLTLSSFVFLYQSSTKSNQYDSETMISDEDKAPVSFFVATGILSLNPLFAAVMAIYNLIGKAAAVFSCQACYGEEECHVLIDMALSMPTEENSGGIVLYMIYLTLYSILFIILLIFIHKGFIEDCLSKFGHSHLQFEPFDRRDTDVNIERELVKSLKEEGDSSTPLIVENMTKTFSLGATSVHNVTFQVSPGECFGILGVFRSGKTTLMEILSGKVKPDKGNANILEYSLRSHPSKYLKSIGYCPQDGDTIDDFTGREMLKMFGLLRGIPHQEVDEVVNSWLTVMDLIDISDVRCAKYSIGSKRKLSTAMAFIGSPVVVLLDEPTAGVDPVSRRTIWNVVHARLGTGQAVVLTSRSAEECEALCSRIAILRDGQMMCVGPPEYLKKKFRHGYTVLIRIADATAADLRNFKLDFSYAFPRSVVNDETHSLIHYHIRDRKLPLSILFTHLLRLQESYPIIEDFTVSHTNLGYLFLTFAKTSMLPWRRRRSTLPVSEITTPAHRLSI